MKKYQHILCPLDLSEHSEVILRQAMEFQEVAGAKLTIVHFIEPLPMTAYNMGVIDLQESIEEKAQKEITKLAEKYKLNKKDVHIIAEHPKRAISSYAKKIGADLLVLGHGEHSVIGSLLGSTASAVANHTPCDVFIVKS